jgi:hypothetical protein
MRHNHEENVEGNDSIFKHVGIERMHLLNGDK